MEIPNRASDAGPEPTPEPDWWDWLDFAGDSVQQAMRAESELGSIPEIRNRNRIVRIDQAIAQLTQAREQLCR
jgi:hypothetical protein